MSVLDKMTMNELEQLEAERYQRYRDGYYFAGGMDVELFLRYSDVANEIQKRLGCGRSESEKVAGLILQTDFHVMPAGNPATAAE
jgi:hypothetical protein